jgi:hypothetical protein
VYVPSHRDSPHEAGNRGELGREAVAVCDGDPFPRALLRRCRRRPLSMSRSSPLSVQSDTRTRAAVIADCRMDDRTPLLRLACLPQCSHVRHRALEPGTARLLSHGAAVARFRRFAAPARPQCRRSHAIPDISLIGRWCTNTNPIFSRWRRRASNRNCGSELSAKW